MKANIEQLKKDIADAKTRHSEATKDIKRIEKDMNDFSNNKDSKLAELQSSLDTLKKSQSKNSTAVKTLQKELQAARLESEQSGGDLAAAQEQLVEVESTLKAQADEIEALQKDQAQVKVQPPCPNTPKPHQANHPTPNRTPTTQPKPTSAPNAPNSPASTTNSSPSTPPRAPNPPSSPNPPSPSKPSPTRSTNPTKTNSPRPLPSPASKAPTTGSPPNTPTSPAPTPRTTSVAKTSANANLRSKPSPTAARV